ncbi:hypothetical protein HK101_004790, partial [Irineochytrium annulatum]
MSLMPRSQQEESSQAPPGIVAGSGIVQLDASQADGAVDSFFIGTASALMHSPPLDAAISPPWPGLQMHPMIPMPPYLPPQLHRHDRHHSDPVTPFYPPTFPYTDPGGAAALQPYPYYHPGHFTPTTNPPAAFFDPGPINMAALGALDAIAIDSVTDHPGRPVAPGSLMGVTDLSGPLVQPYPVTTVGSRVLNTVSVDPAPAAAAASPPGLQQPLQLQQQSPTQPTRLAEVLVSSNGPVEAVPPLPAAGPRYQDRTASTSSSASVSAASLTSASTGSTSAPASPVDVINLRLGAVGGDGGGKVKKPRRKKLSDDKLSIMEGVYQSTPSPALQMRKELAERFDMTERSVQIWFQNRRRKQKTGGQTSPLQSPSVDTISVETLRVTSPKQLPTDSATAIDALSSSNSSSSLPLPDTQKQQHVFPAPAPQPPTTKPLNPRLITRDIKPFPGAPISSNPSSPPLPYLPTAATADGIRPTHPTQTSLIVIPIRFLSWGSWSRVLGPAGGPRGTPRDLTLTADLNLRSFQFEIRVAAG